MSRFKKVNIHKNEFIHDMYTELRNDILKHGKELVQTVLVTMCKVWESPLLKSLENQSHVQSENIYCGSCSFNLHRGV